MMSGVTPFTLRTAAVNAIEFLDRVLHRTALAIQDVTSDRKCGSMNGTAERCLYQMSFTHNRGTTVILHCRGKDF